MTQQQLADRIGAGRRWVSGLESGKPRSDLGLVLSALAALGVSLRADADEDAPTDRSGVGTFSGASPAEPAGSEGVGTALVDLDDLLATYDEPPGPS